MSDRYDPDTFEALEDSLAGATQLTAQFGQELARMQAGLQTTGQTVSRFETSLSRGLARAMDGVVLDGNRLSDALKTVAKSMVTSAYRSAVRPVTDHMAGMITNGMTQMLGGLMPFANGAALSQGRVMPFAKGGVVTGPVRFPMRGATGLMGEAGPEAIMPLTRGPDGRLGVASHGGAGALRPVHVVMHITTPDAASFQRSQGQIAAQMSRALGRGQRNT